MTTTERTVLDLFAVNGERTRAVSYHIDVETDAGGGWMVRARNLRTDVEEVFRGDAETPVTELLHALSRLSD